MAQNGTIFLDEISEMHSDLQSKLLHVLQEKQFYRIGGEREIKVNCRILTATNKKLEDRITSYNVCYTKLLRCHVPADA